MPKKAVVTHILCPVIVGNSDDSTGFVPSCRDGN